MQCLQRVDPPPPARDIPASVRGDRVSYRRNWKVLAAGGGRSAAATFPNEQSFDLAGVEGRLLSSSYAPAAGHPRHEPMLAALRAMFRQFAEAGRVKFLYDTELYVGRLG